MDQDDDIIGLEGWFQGDAIASVESPNLLDISGTYCIYSLRLTQQQLADLDRIMGSLPGHIRTPERGSWYYGTEEDPVFLRASFEPSGILIDGRLRPDQWNEWDLEFRRRVDEAALPRFCA